MRLCTRCGSETDHFQQVNYYYAPILERYRNTSGQIVCRYSKADQKTVSIVLCERCIFKYLKRDRSLSILAALLFMLAGIAYGIYALATLSIDEASEMVMLFPGAIALITGFAYMISSMNYSNGKKKRRAVNRMAMKLAYRTIYIPNGGRRVVTMWREP